MRDVLGRLLGLLSSLSSAWSGEDAVAVAAAAAAAALLLMVAIVEPPREMREEARGQNQSIERVESGVDSFE